MKAIILCSWGATSSSLAKAASDEAKRRNIDVTVDAGGTGEFRKKAQNYSVVLLEPQVRHLRKEVEATASKYNIPVDIVNMQAFAMLNGSKVLDQILSMAENAKK